MYRALLIETYVHSLESFFSVRSKLLYGIKLARFLIRRQDENWKIEEVHNFYSFRIRRSTLSVSYFAPIDFTNCKLISIESSYN